MSRPGWDFDYRPLTTGPPDDSELDDLIVATTADVDPARIVELLGPLAEDIRVESALSSHPLFWTRIQTRRAITRCDCETRLRNDGIDVRYVASVRHGSQRLGAPLDLASALPRRARKWRVRAQSAREERLTPGRWFMCETGVNVRREVCGTGAGTRLAVIDDDAGCAEHLSLDAQVAVGVGAPPRGSWHGAQLVAWAVRAEGALMGDPDPDGFVGVAPDASPRLYLIPKPGQEVLSLALAVVRAVNDGADVIVCSTYVEEQMSPMLDDAFEVAAHLGRDGRGTALVMPCGREASSPPGSVHSCLSLGMGEPASDPRVFCIAPSGRDGAWFLWRDLDGGGLRPFANRGPAVRWLAPGDDMTFPFGYPERVAHAESSGAAAIAAGVLLLVLGQNPDLTLAELESVVTHSVDPVPADLHVELAALADTSDAMPLRYDRDGHNAKHGYGRMNATRACLMASDPVAQALVRMGEDAAADAWIGQRADRFAIATLYSPTMARCMARVALQRPGLRHALASVLRTLRLASADSSRLDAQLDGALVRHLMLLLRTLKREVSSLSPELCAELQGVEQRLTGDARLLRLLRVADEEIGDIGLALWPRVASDSRPVERIQGEGGRKRAGVGA